MKTTGLLFVSLTAATFAAPSFAQDVSRFTANVGGGFTEPVRGLENNFKMGWKLSAGAGVNVTDHLGIIGEFGFNDLGLSRSSLLAAGAPGGSMRIYSGTGNALLHFNPRGRLDPYIVGGGGVYRRTIELTAPTVVNQTFFDPFFGQFFNAPVAASQVLNSTSVTKPGVNVGAGFNIPLGRDRMRNHAKFYAEARYHYIFTDNVRTTMLPVTFGFRW